MSSKLTSICDSDHSDSPPSVLHGAGVFDSLRELSEENMAPTETWDINQTYNGLKSVRVIELPCINCWKKGVPCVESATARSTRFQLCNLGKRNCSQDNHNFPYNPRRLWSSIKMVEDLGWKLFLMNLWPLQFDDIDGEELEITNPIQKRRIQSTSLSPVQASTTTNEVIRPCQPPQTPIRSPTRPSTLASTSTNIQLPVASTSRDPMSPEPESIFESRLRWNISGNFTDQKKVNKKVVTSLFAEVDAFTEVFFDKAMNSAIPGEPTIALAQEAVAYEDALVVKFREALKKF
ncbi:hypothetical protein O181_056753 [Austropuccinia psidii MF-1]|uniref:Uncharacterized protein n=1 Tax=Austropuccinia psidii MF-1 TaxID=1389203 RepID=A0A9Q3EA45_9BASI|nr:hypothetical protein [Austropuccinia psidii MF-1]